MDKAFIRQDSDAFAEILVSTILPDILELPKQKPVGADVEAVVLEALDYLSSHIGRLSSNIKSDLGALSLIMDLGGAFLPARSFFDPTNATFQTLFASCDSHDLLPEHYATPKRLHVLKAAGEQNFLTSFTRIQVTEKFVPLRQIHTCACHALFYCQLRCCALSSHYNNNTAQKFATVVVLQASGI